MRERERDMFSMEMIKKLRIPTSRCTGFCPFPL